MTKIREIVKINSGYTSYVDLYDEYYDIARNRGRMERYKPIAAHRQVFEKVANALNPLDRRFYFLSGSYGTGKSHLLLMLANYFANPSDVPEIESFFRNYETAQNEVLLKVGETLKERKAISLKEARKTGRYLVALCRSGLNLDFEGAVLRSLEDALKKEETELLLDSHYKEAVRRIKDWENRRNETHFYSDLETAISHLYPDWTINKLENGLEKFDDEALKAFRNCFHAVTDTDFAFNKDNLRDIISDFLKNPAFKELYKGIVFLFDEFGGAIDGGFVNYTTLLDFAQFCANSSLERGGSVIFIGTGHKAFRNHGKIGDLNAETLEARVTEIGLQTQGMEDIIAAIVQPKKDASEWVKDVQSQSGKFTWFSGECNRLRLFNWLPAPKIKNNIIVNIYPMHPLATYALLRLAGEAGSDNRSVFKFFAPEFETGEEGWIDVQPYSYPWYLEEHEVVENNKLSLYTANHLVDYFRESLKATNNRLVDRVKTAVINYEATLRELNAYLARKSDQQLFEETDDLMMSIIKVMLVNEIASTQDVSIANTVQNIEFGLDTVAPEEKLGIENRLKLLCDAGILFNNKGVYELRRGDQKNIPLLVEQFKSNPDNRPTNLLQSFLELTPLRGDEVYLEARDYNAQYSEDKRLKVQFATPAMLDEKRTIDGKPLNFFALLEHERKAVTNAPGGYEGTAVYLFCENDAELDTAKKALTQNDQPRVVISLPRAAISVFDPIFTLKALDSEWFKKQSQNFGPYEKIEEKRIRDEASKALTETKTGYFTNIKVLWFGLNGAGIPVQDSKRHDAANQMMLEIYGTKRNTFGHNEFNKTHLNLSGGVKAVFKEAGDILCNLTQLIQVNWSWPDNRGGNRYLRKCFIDHQALRILSVEGDLRYLDAEKDLNKFRSWIPAYAQLLQDLAALEGKGQANLVQFIKPFFEDYGQGEIAMTLMMLLARRFYGDSLRFKREPGNLTDMQFTVTEDMLSLIQGQYPSAVILFEAVSAEDQAYFAKVTQTFTNLPTPAGKVYIVAEAFQATTNWWDALPMIARSLNFYPTTDRPLAEAFSQAKIKDPFRFIKHDLLEQLGLTPGEVLSAGKISQIDVRLKAFKAVAEGIQDGIEKEILIQVAGVFGAATSLDVDIQEALKSWYTGLSSIQKDALGPFHNNESKPLVKFTTYTNIRDLLFKSFPFAYGYGFVENWTSNLVEQYIQRIRIGKTHIETKAPQISQLTVDFENSTGLHNNQVTYEGNLVIHANTEDGQGLIWYTKDGSDPTTSKTREKLTPGDSLTITGTCNVRLVVADEKCNYSAVRTIEAIDELIKYRICRSKQKTAFDEMVSFVFPTSKTSAWMTISSLIIELYQASIFTDAELRLVLQHALEEIKNKTP